MLADVGRIVYSSCTKADRSSCLTGGSAADGTVVSFDVIRSPTTELRAETREMFLKRPPLVPSSSVPLVPARLAMRFLFQISRIRGEER